MYSDIIAEKFISQLIKRYPALISITDTLDKTYNILKTCFKNGNKLLLAGNGGSAADSEHVVGQLMKSFIIPRPIPAEIKEKLNQISNDNKLAESLQMGLPSISLISHPALNTAYLNDVNPEMIFAQQLFVLGNKGDVIIGFSTSGNSINICHAFQTAKAKEITTILFTGTKHGICEKFSDIIIHAPETETYKIQEYHLPIYHCLCMMLEEAFFGNNNIK